MQRRTFLQAGLASGQIALAATAGILTPIAVLASEWPADSFFADNYQDALAAIYAADEITESESVSVEANDIAENGASVPIAVRSDLAGPLTLSLFSINNPTPAIARFELSPRLKGFLSTRIKMAESGDVVAVVTAEGRHYSAHRRIQVVSGGCA